MIAELESMAWCDKHGVIPRDHCYLHALGFCQDPECGPCPRPIYRLHIGPEARRRTAEWG
jgi:hypothetical protein